MIDGVVVILLEIMNIFTIILIVIVYYSLCLCVLDFFFFTDLSAHFQFP